MMRSVYCNHSVNRFLNNLQCLEISENHFFAGDGLLQSLCAEENYLEAYGFALHWISKYPNYERGHHVIRQTREMFDTTLNFIER